MDDTITAEKKKCIGNIVSTFSPFDEDMFLMIRGHVMAYSIGKGDAQESDKIDILTSECLVALKQNRFVDKVYDAYNSFFTLDELRALNTLAQSDVMKKVYSKKMGNPITNVIFQIHKMVQEMCEELWNK